MASSLLMVVIIWGIILLPTVTSSLVHFDQGHQYEYEYKANVTLDKVDTMRIAAKVFFVCLANETGVSELLLQIDDFRLGTKRKFVEHKHELDFSKWFSAVISSEGEVIETRYPTEEDDEVLTVKKSIIGLLAGKYLKWNKEEEGTSKDSWFYTTEEHGPEGKHSSMYQVVQDNRGKTFKKTRVLYKHPLPNADGNHEKTVYIDDDIGTIHSVTMKEDVTASHIAPDGFEPYYGMRKVEAVNEFENIKYPDWRVLTGSTLVFVRKLNVTERSYKRPTDLVIGHLQSEMKRKPTPYILEDIKTYLSDIKSNLTCMRRKEEHEKDKRLECFAHILKNMRVLPDEELENITHFYFKETKLILQRSISDRNSVLDALGAIATDKSQDLLLKYVLREKPPDDDLIQRVLVHIATSQEPPSENIIVFLEEALDQYRYDAKKLHITTYHRIVLTIGAVARKLQVTGKQLRADKLISQLHDMLQIHDPWNYRLRRALMNEEEQADYDNHNVVLLEALGNGCHEKSYEYILSHLNTTNSPWIKRAGIHALRKYDNVHPYLRLNNDIYYTSNNFPYHFTSPLRYNGKMILSRGNYDSKAANTLLGLALHEDNEEVRYEAMLQYQAHPQAADQPNFTSETSKSKRNTVGPHTHAIHRRSASNPFDQVLNYNLAAPSVDWKNVIGSKDIGASFGVIMINFMALKVSPLSGLFRIVVHDEVYARLHLGFFGINVDFFSARICFKGSADYSVNVFQELDPRLNPALLKSVVHAIKNIADGIKAGIDTIKTIINGEFSLKRIVEDFLDAVQELPGKILNLRTVAVSIMEELGELIMDSLPDFFRPVKALIDYVANLFNTIKTNIWDFYKMIVQTVKTVIPNSAKDIFKSASGIIEIFPTLFKDPLTAVARIGKGVVRIAMRIKQLLKTKKTIEDATFLKVIPFWKNIHTEYEKLVDMVNDAFKALVVDAPAWFKEVATSDDVIASLTGGKMSTNSIRKRVTERLKLAIEELFEPFTSLWGSGQRSSETFSEVFELITNFKRAYNKLKTGYKQARAAIDSIFGPKCHKEFPRLYRLSDESCSRDGFYPSKLGSGNREYEHKGIDLILENGKEIVSPFSGNIMLTNTENQVKLTNVAEMVSGSEVIIDNIQPDESIDYPSNDFYIDKKVSAGDKIGTVQSSSCGPKSNHIHFAVLKNGKPVDPSRFMLPRPPSKPKWIQECDDYRVVYKAETIAAGAIVGIGGKKEEDTSGHVPETGSNPEKLDSSSEPSYDTGGSMYEKVKERKRRRKRSVLDTAKQMLDVLLENVEAFLEHELSISRIQIGEIAMFADKLGLDETKEALQDIVHIVKNAINEKPCKSPDAMTNNELQMELISRGLTSSGSREGMLKTLFSGDKSCPRLAITIPKLPNAVKLYCSYNPDCLGIECCISLNIANILQKTYKAYVVFDAQEMALTVGINNWKKEFYFEVDYDVIEDTIRTGLKFQLLDMELLCRYKIEKTTEAVILTFGTGFCTSPDSEECITNIIEDAILPIPVILNNGSIIWPKVDWNNYLSLESVKAKLDDVAEGFVEQGTEKLIETILTRFNIPKDFLENNPRCPIPENLLDAELNTLLQKKQLPGDGSRSNREQMLRLADRTCSPLNGTTLTFPEIENDDIRDKFYYSVSQDCMSIQACLDVNLEDISITKTFSAFVELDPCHYEIRIGIERWKKTYYLIDYKWGSVSKVKLTDSVYISYVLDKLNKTDEFVLDAEMVIENLNYHIQFMKAVKIPIPLCNGNFKLPGNGDIASLADNLGGLLSQEAFNIFLLATGIHDMITDNRCELTNVATDCQFKPDDFIPDELKSIVRCEMLENCWGMKCCLNFEFDIPLSTLTKYVSMPIMIRYEPCEFSIEIMLGPRSFKKWFVEYNWGYEETISFGEGAPVKLRYSVNKFDEGFTVDVELKICIPVQDRHVCFPNGQPIHLIENEHIPLCNLGQGGSEGLPKVSLTEWLAERGHTIIEEIGQSGIDYLLEAFDLKDVVSSSRCKPEQFPYSPTVDGWNIACKESFMYIPPLPDFVVCHIDKDCSHISCCVSVPVIDIAIQFELKLDLCENSISIGLENAMKSIDDALSKYEWGKPQQIKIGQVLLFEYNIQKPSHNVYIVDIHFAACFERNGDCLLNKTMVGGLEIPRSFCMSTNESCHNYVNDLAHQCAMDVDCLGITCDIKSQVNDIPDIPISLRMNECTKEVLLTLDNMKWEQSLTSILPDQVHTFLAGPLELSLTIDETAIQYVISLNVSMCEFYTDHDGCEDVQVFTELHIRKYTYIDARKRRKRETSKIETQTILDGLKKLKEESASNEDIDEFLQIIQVSNEDARRQNYDVVELDMTDSETTLISAVKALGNNNFMSIPFSPPDTGKTEVVEVQGADLIIAMLEASGEIYDKGKTAYVIGKGLTKAGLIKVGRMLASMTITDLEALLELNNADPTIIHHVIESLIDLTSALVSETIEAVASGQASNAFESFDIVLSGRFKFPEMHAELFSYSAMMPPGAPISVVFEFGAGCAYGIDAGVGFKILSMVATASVIPKGGLSAFGSAGLCLGPLCLELRLVGQIMNVQFPTTAEVGFSKFPLDVGLRMDLRLIPLRLVLSGVVTLRISIPFCCSLKLTIWKQRIWSYSAAAINKPIFHLTNKEKDPDPPQFQPVTEEEPGTQHFTLNEQHCEVFQLPGLDYTEPAFQISVAAEDSLSQVRFFLNVGTTPGGNDVVNEENLGGALTKMSKVLSPTGVPLYFTMFAQNSQGSRSSVTCKLHTYDVTLPSGRFEAEFATSSNPRVLKSSVVVHDDSPIVEAFVAIGFGEGIYGDQIKPFTPTNFDERDFSIDIGDDPSNLRTLEPFTGMKNGRLIGQKMYSESNVHTAGDCARKCLNLPEHSCLSINYDYGKSGLCELLKIIEGHDYIVSQDGLFSHYERKGIGYAVELSEDDLNLEHNYFYEFNLDMTNSLGYRHIITTKGILIDFTTPEPGLIMNVRQDYLESIPCLSLLSEDRPDLKMYCIGVDPSRLNHRVVIDGEGSQTVFNGPESMTDMKYTRINNYVSANWNGFHDNETSIRFYTFAVGRDICDNLIHPHHDPHRHLLSESQWTNTAQISPLPPPYTSLPDGSYFMTVKAINKVTYGGPLGISVCHTTPYIVDTSPPLVDKIHSLRYNVKSFYIYGKINISDPHSGIAEYDLCLGKTTRTCDILPWFKYDYKDEKLEHRYKLPDGVPVWVRIRAINNVLLSTVGVSDQGIIVDSTGPFAGHVFDGPHYKEDLQYSKDSDMICVNWFDFYDPESGISKYRVGIGREPGKTDVIKLTEISGKQHSTCLILDQDIRLEHGKIYFAVVWAYNGAINQRNASAISNGVLIDLSPPILGSVVDGNQDNFEDLKYSSAKSSLAVQWDGFSDPESGIKEYAIKVLKQNENNWITLTDWTRLENSVQSVSWKSFHHNHKDFLKVSVRARNGALNDRFVETNGVLIDLTAPVMDWLNDGNIAASDIDFQTSATHVTCSFRFYDNESGLATYKFQVYEKYNGQRKKIWPDNLEWEEHSAAEPKSLYERTDLHLISGAMYTIRVGVTNNAGVMAIHETNGIRLDLTAPKIKWLNVGVFSGESEDLFNGFVYQSDHKGIKLSLLAMDPESGVIKVTVKIGTNPGSDDIKQEQGYDGRVQDIYLTGFNLDDTDISLHSPAPVYYVSVVAYNGAGVQSNEVVSSPIAVLAEDVPGIVYDGIKVEAPDDIDYDVDSSSVSVKFSGFESALHGISSFVWAVGTKPGLEDVQPFTEIGIYTSEEGNDAGTGVIYSGVAQLPLTLNHGITYYTAVRGVTNQGNVIESSSDGVLIDLTPGSVEFDKIGSYSEGELKNLRTLYEKDINQLNAEWHYFDEEYKAPGVLDNINATWFSVGTYPQGDDILELIEQPVGATYDGDLRDVLVTTNQKGKPFILNVYAKNEAGHITVNSAKSLIVDTSSPVAGTIKCPFYMQPTGRLKCTWSSFYDRESPLQEYIFSLGTAEGLSNVISEVSLPANTTWFQTDAFQMPLHGGMVMYATVTAINSVELRTYQFSNKIMVDSSPPIPGVVVELSQDHVFDDDGKRKNKAYSCSNQEDCLDQDIVCQESLNSLLIAWEPFEDKESGITEYQVAVGSTVGGTEIKDFYTIAPSPNQTMFMLKGLTLYGVRQVFVKIKAINGAGLSSTSTSNGVFISYLSQGLEPLLPVGIWDADPLIIGDINYQTDTTTVWAAWDVSGDPCPVVKYEWAVERLDGHVIQEFTEVQGGAVASNDQQQFQNGEVYYSLLRVTNALNYKYILRSDGVTVHDQPLAPGSVYDGNILGYDLPIIDSKTTVTCNWRGFGMLSSETIESVITGNIGKHVSSPEENQMVDHYEVGLGTDRRFSKTRDNIVPFTNAGKSNFYTFTNLDLIPGNAVYYCTVHAYSTSLSTSTVTSNGFSVSFNGGVLAGEILMPEYISSDKEMSVQWDGFESKVEMMLYYVAVSEDDAATKMDCKQLIESSEATGEQTNLFKIQNVKNVALNTHVVLANLQLSQGHMYYVYVIGVDFSAECNMTMVTTTVDLTPPTGGHVTAGPYFNMKLAFTPRSDIIDVTWDDYYDAESGVQSYELSLWTAVSCDDMSELTQIGDFIKVGHVLKSFKFRDLEMSKNQPYIVKLNVLNRAGLVSHQQTSPVLFDDSQPKAGHVVEGTKYMDDIVWWGSTDSIKGSFLHFPSSSALACPSRKIQFHDNDAWNKLNMPFFRQPGGRLWKTHFLPEHVKVQTDYETVEIKMSRDTKYEQMLTGAFRRSADLENGGEYQVTIQAAGGNGLAVTEIMFHDAPLNDYHIYNYEEELDWTHGLCLCCHVTPVPNDCPCSNCDEYIESLKARETTTNGTGESFSTSVKPTVSGLLKPPQKDWVVVDESQKEDLSTFDGKMETEEKIKQKGCGMQIINGQSPYVVLWCRFFNDSSRDMVVQTDLQFDPATAFHTYKIVYTVIKESLLETWELEAYIDGHKRLKLSGIPQLSISTQFIMQVWNRDNYIPELSDVFRTWEVAAKFKDLIFPPEVGELCRYGAVFQSGTNPIVRYEVGIGSQIGLTDVQPFTEVLYPCIPCTDECSKLHCDPLCIVKTEKLDFRLDNLHLESSVPDGNETQLANYYLGVKAVLSSGENAISYSNGFYIDTTAPTFDSRVFMYVNVDQGDFTPSKYQSSNSTIKGVWLCVDDENEIEEYQWAIGTTPGGTDIQDFMSTGRNPSGINSHLEGILKTKTRYYMSLRCTNEAGLTALYIDETGVEVLLTGPDADKLTGQVVGAQPFDSDVYPVDALKSDNHERIGGGWDVLENSEAVNEYDFCIGSKLNVIDDIFPCVWCGYNMSGSVEIKDGYLTYGGQNMYSLKELGKKVASENDTGKFHMETGRILYPNIRLCNKAALCNSKPLGTVTITSPLTKTKFSDGSLPLVFTVTNNDNRKKREATPLNIQVETPADLHPGQAVMVSHLTEDDLSMNYQSDASDKFVPYISNPNVSAESTERLLSRRITSFESSFTVVSVGQLQMTGPLLITFQQMADDPLQTDIDITMLVHWNPDDQQWQISSRTCLNETDSLSHHTQNKTTTVQVCDTRVPSSGSYFSIQTQFAIVIAKSTPVNHPPVMQAVPVMTMYEDEGTLIAQLTADDPDDDNITFTMSASATDFPGVASELKIENNGRLTFKPCSTCYGTLRDIKIIITDIPEYTELSPLSTISYITIDVISVNNAPVIFVLDYDGTIIQHADRTDEIMVYRENVAGIESFSALIVAYDLDSVDQLSVVNATSSNGTFLMNEINQETRDKYFHCNNTWCLNAEPEKEPWKMTWFLAEIKYSQSTSYTGVDQFQLVIQDLEGAFSDVITINIVMMEMPCLNGGECLVTSQQGYSCQDTLRTSDFYNNYACVCTTGWTGDSCEQDVNECDFSPCASPYTCNNLNGTYECKLAAFAIALIVLSLVALAAILIVSYLFRHKIKLFLKGGKKVSSESKYEDTGNVTSMISLEEDVTDLVLQAPMSTQMTSVGHLRDNKQSLQEVTNLMAQHREVDDSSHPKPNPLLKPKQHLTGNNALPIPDFTVDNAKHPKHNPLSKTDQHDTVSNAPPISYFMAGGGMENARRKFQARKELLEDTDNLKDSRGLGNLKPKFQPRTMTDDVVELDNFGFSPERREEMDTDNLNLRPCSAMSGLSVSSVTVLPNSNIPIDEEGREFSEDQYAETVFQEIQNMRSAKERQIKLNLPEQQDQCDEIMDIEV